MQLYQYQNFGSNKSSNSYGARLNGAPRLVPVGPNGGGFIQSESAGYSLIDVINKFQWTTTPQLGRQEVPAVYLKEKRLVTNALVAQSIYYGLALAGTAGGGVAGFNALPKNLQQAALAFGGAFAAKQVGSVVGSIVNSLGGLAGNLLKNPGVGNAIGAFGGLAAPGFGIAGFNFGLTADTDLPNRALAFADDTLQNLRNYIPQRFNIESLGSDTLKPYEGLYITEDTRFLYNIPYFSNRQNFVSNSFDTSDEAFTQINPTQTQYLTEAVRDLAMGSSVLFNMDAPGIYVEKPKFYQFGSGGEDISFSFPLINTGWSTFEDVLQNWQLLYLLTYQNRPNRRSRDLIDPPAIYEVTIPGVRYSPFAYIEQMEVNFAGARRRMNIPVPFGSGTTTINTIIPDAYVVTIRMKTLVGETQNFLYSMLSDKQNIVTVSNRTNPADYGRTVLNDAYNQVKQINQNRTQPFAQGLSDFVGNVMGGGGVQGGGLQ
jgi:hypothetical protein